MKKLFFILPVAILYFIITTGQKSPEAEKWNLTLPTNIYDPSNRSSAPLPQVFEYNNPNSVRRTVITPYEVLAVEPNFRILPRNNSYQSEVIITRHPLNPMIMFGSSNAFNNTGSLFISEGVYVTTNGGVNWFGSDTMKLSNGTPVLNQGGDPGIAIEQNGTFIQTHLGFTTSGMFGNYSTDNGISWSANFVIATGSQDKNLATTDDAPSSPYYGRSYVAWSLFNLGSPPVGFSYTTNSGVTWSTPPIQINTSVAGHYSQGTDLRVGPNGEVYVVWAAPISGSPFTEDFLGFAKSTNGGVNWTVTNNAYDMNGIRGTFPSKANIRVNGFPRIDVDRSGGPRNGWIYVVTAERNLAPAGSDPDIILHKSTDGGTTWSAGIRVNQDPLNNGKFQWFPAIRVDEAGGVNIVYYDDRNTASDSSEIYVSRSLNGGDNWTDILVSDHRFKPKSIGVSGIATGYQGDYIGMTSGNSKLWPLWMDDASGIYQAWTTSIQLANYPLNAFNLLTPPAGSTISSFPNSSTPITMTWDTSASTASYKWIFGPAADPRRITLPTSGNSLNLTAGQLDNILAGIGLAQGQSLVGQWDVWAFRNSSPDDSMKAANGPRTLTLTRGVPALTVFNLSSPPNGTTITTSAFNSSTINMNWTRSGQGTTYKWKFGSPAISNVRLTLPAGGSGYDSSLSIINNELDGLLGGIGLNPGDSLIGEYAVWAYNATDSLKSAQTYTMTLKRQAKGNVIVLYDSTSTGCRIARDSVVNNLNSMTETYDLFNRRSQTTGTTSISFRGYKKVILLGEGTSVVSNVVKDSIKAYLNAGGTTTGTKSKLIIFSEDIGYQLDRTGSTYLDTTFFRTVLGCQYVADRPGTSGNRGLVGVTVNLNMADSTVGTWPDILKKSSSAPAGQLYDLYRFRLFPDSLNGIGRIGTNYNISTMAVDVESMRRAFDSPPGSPVARFLEGAIDFVDGNLTDVSPVNPGIIPLTFSLAQNYPNPFNPSTKINFSIPKQGLVTLKIYDVLGKEVMTLVNETKAIGNYEVDFNGSNLASGAYFYRIEAGEFTDIKRMILIK